MRVATAETRRWRSAAILAVLPVAIVLVGAFGPLSIDPVYRFGGATYAANPPLATGLPTIDGNAGVTSQALGTRAAGDVLAGRWPLWNHEEGLGTPPLGEMQSAAPSQFRFRPRLFGPAVAGAAVALLALAGIAATWATGRRRRVASPGSASRSPAA